jgi:Ca-activated chloride channel family protein
MTIRLAALLILVVVAPVATQQTPVFRDVVRVVPVYATVTARDGRLLTNLNQDDFTVFDNGKPANIVSFSHDPVRAITIAAAWDVSESMKKVEVRERLAARALVDALTTADRLRFGTFGDAVVFSPLLTSDKTTLHRIVTEEMWFGGNTPLWTTIDRGLRQLAGETGRRVLIVLSDGRAKNDTTARDDVLRLMQRLDCLIYAVGLEGPGLSAVLKDVAEESGGGHVELPNRADLDREFDEILFEIHDQYVIGIRPDVLDDTMHSLVVRTTAVGATVRARNAYLASKEPPR